MTGVEGVVLSNLEFDLLWTDLALGELPYPLEVPSHGHTMAERDELGGQVFDTLDEAGLIDGDEIAADLEDQLTLLSDPALSVDALLIGEVPLRLLAAAGQRQAVLAVLDHAELALRPIAPDALVPVVAEVIGDAPPGRGQEVRLPRAVFSAAMNAFATKGHSGLEWVLAQAGITGRETRALSTLATAPRTCSGQLAANGPGGRSPIVSWFDTEAGRYAARVEQIAGDSWVTLTPADGSWLAARTAELTDRVR
ncbi:MAG TPA: ESX secretion-associated protein EspG [Amycolatopsis sp.]|nr:ESX secretion-associated protein EspG [Amycolatopsis sp.]